MFKFLTLISICSIINSKSISIEMGDKVMQKNSLNSPLTSTNQYKDFVQRSLNPMDMINRNGFVHNKFELKRRLEMKKTTKQPETTSQTVQESIPDSFFTSYHWGPQGK
jgi:hypothetical protein